jgi:DNA-binding GntR family transcriptional regulator
VNISQVAAAPNRSDGQSVDMVYARLRRRILDGTLEPGVELAQAHLAKELGVSRTPLREALRMLSRDGLVEGEPHHSLRVTKISPASMDEHWAVRVGLETIAIRVAAPLLTVQDFAALEGDLAQMEYLGERRDFDSYEAAHRAFHMRLIRPAGDEMVHTIGELTDRGARFRRMWRYLREWPLNAGGHRVIAEACAARDPDAAVAMNAAHIAGMAYALMRFVDPTFEPVLLPTAIEMAQTPVDPRRKPPSGSGSGVAHPQPNDPRP